MIETLRAILEPLQAVPYYIIFLAIFFGSCFITHIIVRISENIVRFRRRRKRYNKLYQSKETYWRNAYNRKYNK